MTAFFCALGLTLSVILCPQAQAQEMPPDLRDRAMVLLINTKIEENSQEIWNSQNSRVTIPGRPVSIKLVGENLVVEILFTPYVRAGRYSLVAQSQVWINIPDQGMSYKTNTYTIPIDFGEPILYFPLGSDPTADNPRIELHLTMYRYGEVPENPEVVPTETGTAPAGEGAQRPPRARNDERRNR